MDKFSEFYVKVMENDIAKKEFAEILEDRNIEEASDKQLLRMGKLAKKLGMEITLDEAKNYLRPSEKELADDDLDAVAGGKGERHEKILYACQVGGQAGVDDDNFGEGASTRIHG